MNVNKCSTCKLCKNFRTPKGDSDCNLLPLVSESTFFGPSIDENIIYLISFLPKCWLDKIGFFHDQESEKKKGGFDLDKWLKCEYMTLAREINSCGLNTNDTCGRVDTQMIESRRFVLNRLAELMEKKNEIERSINCNIKND